MTRESVGDLLLDHEPPRAHERPVPIVFVHGLWAGAWLWERWLPLAAARGWDAWALDLRGRGGSRPTPDLGKVRIADFAQDVRDALAQLGDAVLIGHSMGGLVAQVVAATDPHVRAAALLCSVPPAGIVALSGPVLRRAGRYLAPMARGAPLAQRRADADAVIMNGLAASERDALFPRFIADSGTVAREIALGRVTVDASAVMCPTLVGGATRDRISPPGLQPRLAARYGAERLTFEGRGHLVMFEEGWQGAADRVLAWADRAASGPHPPV